jgi:hypothetical protein
LIFKLTKGKPLNNTFRRRLGGYVAFGHASSAPVAGAARRLRAVVAGAEPQTPHGGITRYIEVTNTGMEVRSLCAEVAPGEVAAFTECGKSAHALSSISDVVPLVIRQQGALNVYPDAEVYRLAEANDHMLAEIKRAGERHSNFQCRLGGMKNDRVRALTWGYGMHTTSSAVDEKWVNEVFQDYAQTKEHSVYTVPFLTVVRDLEGPRPHAEHSRDPLVGIWAHGAVRDGVAALVTQNAHAETITP